MSVLDGLLWSTADGSAAVEAVGQAAGLVVAGRRAGSVPGVGRAEALGLDLHGVRTTYDTLPDLIAKAGPALLTVFSGEGPPKLLAVIGPADLFGRVPVLCATGDRRRVSVARLVASMRAGIEASEAPRVDAALDLARLPSGRARDRSRAALLAKRLHGRPMGGGQLLRAAPHAPALALARDAGVLGPLGVAVVARLLSTALSIGGWILIGQGALEGRLSPGWLGGWCLLLLTGLVFGRVVALAQGEAAIRAGVWTKQALLRGAMSTDPEAWRKEGPGGALARVGESQAIEDLVLTGGLEAILAVVDLAAAAWVLAQGAAGLPLAGTLVLGVGVAAVAAWRMMTLLGRWTAHRRGLTAMLVERMAGHRTRLAQAEPDRLYAGEDDALEAYMAAFVPLHRLQIAASAWLGGGWTVLALGVLALPFVVQGTGGVGMAVSVGGLLLAQGALASIGGHLDGLASAAVSWREVGPLLQAARTAPQPARVPPPRTPATSGELIRAKGLAVGWPGRPPVLRDVDLSVAVGDRVLITGPSGGGKSTLAGVLTGARAPSDGLLLLRGLDRTSIGPRQWRKTVAQAPQFHENHIFENTLSFNLLLGRSWPPSPQDLAEALRLCRALGLGPLLDKMPAGLNQVVGESGWQLSHGERSRVFLARALLQEAEVVVLDESFAALDPLSLRQCLEVTLRSARTLVVIAHP